MNKQSAGHPAVAVRRRLTGQHGDATLRGRETVGGRTVTLVVLVVAICALFSACSNNGPTAPSNNTPAPPSASSNSNLKITSMNLVDAGQDASGHWQYNGKIFLETGDLEVTVTNIQVQALLGSNIVATASAIPMLLVPAKSSSNAAFVFAADSHAQASELTVNVTVQFTGTNGNSGTVSSSGSCFGCWDY